MNETIKVSLIMPAYNIAAELSRSIESVLNQTYSNIELIIIDDGSTDSTPRVIKHYAEYNNNIISVHRDNGGVFSARIDGVRKATGGYIGFIDGDDFIEPEMIERLLENALSCDADISHCGYQMVFPSGRTDCYYGTGKRVIQDRKKGLVDLIEGVYIEPGLWNKLYRKELFCNIESLNLDYSIKINEDLLLNYYLFKESKCSIYEDQCYYHYMIRPNSAATSSINENKLSDPLKVLRTMLDDNKSNELYYNLILIRLMRQLISVATISSKANPILICPHKKAARRELRKRLFPFLMCHNCNVKIKAMAVWAAIMPATYQAIHYLYEKYTGLDKKYSTDR